MAGLAGRHILTVGGTTFDWEDLVLCGHLWGDWPALRRRVAAGLACLARLDDLDEDDPDSLDEKDVEATAAEFRYARDLVAAEDLEAWLERRGLDSEAWLDWVRRTLLLARWAEDLDDIAGEYPIDDDDVEEALECEAICSGLAASLASRLAARAAIDARLRAERPDAGPSPDAVQPILAAVPQGVIDAGGQRLEALARLELAWREFTVVHATPAALRSVVAARRLDWIRVSVRTVVAPDRDMASELLSCVRNDGRDLASIADEIGLPVTESSWYLDETDERLHDLLVGARPGDVLGPVPHDDGVLLVAVPDKVLPAEDDPAVRERAERVVMDRLVAREIEARVRWHETP